LRLLAKTQVFLFLFGEQREPLEWQCNSKGCLSKGTELLAGLKRACSQVGEKKYQLKVVEESKGFLL